MERMLFSSAAGLDPDDEVAAEEERPLLRPPLREESDKEFKWVEWVEFEAPRYTT